MNVVRKYCNHLFFTTIFILTIFLCVGEIRCMSLQEQIDDKVSQAQARLGDNEFYVYDQETGDGIVVAKNLVKYTNMMFGAFEDFTALNNAVIPLPFSKQTIELAFRFLMIDSLGIPVTQRSIGILDLQTFISVTRCLNYMTAAPSLLAAFGQNLVMRVANYSGINYEVFNDIPLDFAKIFLMPVLMEPVGIFVARSMREKHKLHGEQYSKFPVFLFADFAELEVLKELSNVTIAQAISLSRNFHLAAAGHDLQFDASFKSLKPELRKAVVTFLMDLKAGIGCAIQ